MRRLPLEGPVEVLEGLVVDLPVLRVVLAADPNPGPAAAPSHPVNCQDQGPH